MKGVVRVSDGRGFVTETALGLVVVTAAHCLPHLPPASSVSYVQERTYGNILGPLDEEPSVWAECLFVDPVADIAILGEPDSQELCDEWEAYDSFIGQCEPIKIVGAIQEQSVRMLSLSGEWFTARGRCSKNAMHIDNKEQSVESGMSGSPILGDDGAVSLVSTGGPCEPALMECLPLWAVRPIIF